MFFVQEVIVKRQTGEPLGIRINGGVDGKRTNPDDPEDDGVFVTEVRSFSLNSEKEKRFVLDQREKSSNRSFDGWNANSRGKQKKQARYTKPNFPFSPVRLLRAFITSNHQRTKKTNDDAHRVF